MKKLTISKNITKYSVEKTDMDLSYVWATYHPNEARARAFAT